MPQPRTKTWMIAVTWILQLAVAVLLLQTMFFKLMYAPQTQVIFESIGGRAGATGSALAELIAAGLLLYPAGWLSRFDEECPDNVPMLRGWTDLGGWLRYANVLGAIMALGILSGAIMTHLTIIGIDIPVAPGSTETDGGSLFAMAIFIAVASIAIIGLRLHDLVNFKTATLTLLGSKPEPAK